MKVLKNKVYKHFKGNYYIVVDIAKNSENLEDMVIYRGLYGDNELWVRPLKEFTSAVDKEKYKDVKQKYRFELKDFK